MGRKRTRLELTDAERATIDHHLKTTRDVRKRERMAFALNASTGKHTIEDLAQLSGRRTSTIQNWIGKFERGGLAELLARGAPPGKKSQMLNNEIQTELIRGLLARRWTTAQQVSEWLNHRHGIKLARKSIYYWLRKIDRQSVANA